MFEKEKGKMKKIISSVLVVLTICGYADSVMATQYECNTKQANIWRGGTLIPQKNDVNSYNGTQSVIRFDDETSAFSESVNPAKDTPFDQFPFKIVDKIIDKTSSVHKLLAVYDGGDANSGSFFRLQGSADNSKIVFLSYIASLERLSTGTCHVVSNGKHK